MSRVSGGFVFCSVGRGERLRTDRYSMPMVDSDFILLVERSEIAICGGGDI